MKLAKNALFISSLLVGSAGAVSIAMDRGGGSATGMVVVGSASTTTDPTLTTSLRVPAGSLIRWGTMNGAISSANFTQFATTIVDNTASTTFNGGSIRNPIEVTGTLAAVANIQVYMWVYGAATASSTVEQGLFTSTTWRPGSDFGTDGSATFTFVLGQTATAPGPAVTVVPISGFAGMASVTIGSIKNSATGTANPDGFIYKLGAVPEPSVALLGALGTLGFFLRRRS